MGVGPEHIVGQPGATPASPSPGPGPKGRITKDDVIATLREPATAAPAAPGGDIPEVPARVAGTVSAVRVSAGFTSPHQLRVELAEGGTTVIDFEQAIIAAGSEPLTLPFIPASDPRIMDSTGAPEVGEVPERLLILGGGIMAWRWPPSTTSSARRSPSPS